jgi:hypothetical protein
MLSTIATDIKDVSLSADGKEVTFVLVTKYSGDIAVTLPAACLQKLQPATVPAPLPATTTGEHVGGQKVDGVEAPNNITVSVPNRCVVVGDKQHGRVVVVLNPSLPGQYAFALSTKSAADISAAMVKEANAVTANQKDDTSRFQR